MKKLLLLCALITASGTFFLSSCSKDSNLYDPNQKVNEYNNSWNQQFGAIDPTQDWNVATTVSATAACPTIAGESEMRIYSDAPLEDESNLMAVTKLTNGAGSISFDAKKAANHVFVSIKNSEGLFKIYNYYAIVNGTVNITPSDYITPTRSGFTRAANCPVTKGEKKTISNKYTVVTGKKTLYTYNHTSKTFEEWKAYAENYAKNNDPKYACLPWTDESILVYKTVVHEWGNTYVFDHFDWSNPVLKDGATVTEQEITEQRDIQLTLLNGVAQEEAVPCWTVGQAYKLFGPGTFFMEQQRYYSSEKMHLYTNGIEDLKKVEKGFSIVTKGGEIKMPVVYGATQNSNRLGYIYYKDGQDPLAQPHYILINDARPQSNIYFNRWKGQTLNDNMELSGWNSTTEGLNTGKNKDTKMYGTSYKLAFFGDNHDQEATYNFPAGYHIVFFIAGYNPSNYNDYSNQNGYYAPEKYNYSLPELNKRINHLDWNTNCPTYISEKDQWGNTVPARGAIKAASWTFNGQTFLGFEDGGNDEDLNVIVFWVQGQYTTPEPPITVPDPDPLPEPQSESWIIACEDLGNTDDIDFNDVVFSVSHTAGETTAKVTPLAAGGVLPSNIYYDGRNLGEIHNLINGAQPSANGQYSMLNTGSKGTPGSAITITVPADYSVTNHGFTVKVKDQNESIVLESAEIGTAPQMLVLPGEWAWPTERTPIGTAFPMFVDWSKAANTAIDWYKSPVEGKVVK